MNKAQSKFIMELPDGYEWTFLNDDKFIAGRHSEKELLLYEIVEEKLIRRKVILDATVEY